MLLSASRFTNERIDFDILKCPNKFDDFFSEIGLIRFHASKII